MSPRELIEARGIRIHEQPPEYPNTDWRISLDDECGRFAYGPDRDEVIGRLARRVIADRPIIVDRKPGVSRGVLVWMVMGFAAGLFFCWSCGVFR